MGGAGKAGVWPHLVTVGNTSAAKRLLRADTAWEARRPRTERDHMVHSGRSGDGEKARILPVGPGLPASHHAAPPCAGRGCRGLPAAPT